jgi:hypothetical protein
LISLSVAPSSYFFYANAERDAVSNAAADTPPTKPRLLVINASSFVETCDARFTRKSRLEKGHAAKEKAAQSAAFPIVCL